MSRARRGTLKGVVNERGTKQKQVGGALDGGLGRVELKRVLQRRDPAAAFSMPDLLTSIPREASVLQERTRTRNFEDTRRFQCVTSAEHILRR
jgi:hypothetical protein